MEERRAYSGKMKRLQRMMLENEGGDALCSGSPLPRSAMEIMETRKHNQRVSCAV